MAMRKLLLYLIICIGVPAQAQVLTGVGTRWNDSFAEWIIYTDDDDIQGELRQRWAMNNDWTEWQYRIGEQTGTIRVKWKQNPNEWELRGSNEIVTIRTRWSNDPREWRITGSHNFIIKNRYGNVFDEWQIEEDDYGYFGMITNWEGDPRDWTIYDELDESVSLPTRLAMVFTVIFNSSPKW